MSLLCFVCVEHPRLRSAERYDSTELARAKWVGGERAFQLADISITGARILGACPISLGEPMELSFSDCNVDANVVRVERAAFAVVFDYSFSSRITMTRHFYRNGYIRPLRHIRLLKVGVALARRLLD